MPGTSPSRGSCRIDALEPRRLLSTIDITRFGARPDDGVDDRQAINAAIRNSAPGDVIAVPTGTFNVAGSIELPTGRSLQGVAGSTLEFVTGRRDFAILLPGGASNIKIDGLAIRANCGIVQMVKRGGYSNIQITNNDFQWGYDGTYYNRLAVRVTTGANGLVIEKNYFHHSPTSDRNVDLWNLSNSSYSYNTFYQVHDGGHILESRDNVSVRFNVGRKIHRMGIEIQGLALTTNMTVEGNVFFDWDRPWNDTFGLSVMPMRGTNVRIINNYISADFTGPWGESMPGTGGPRFGIGIEAGFTTGIVSGNTVIGPWATGVAAAMKNTLIKGNSFYGRSLWGWLIGEPGYNGHGSYISQDNQFFGDTGGAPPPPADMPLPDGTGGWTPPGGWEGDWGGTPNPTPGGSAPILSFLVVSTSQIMLSWTDLRTDEDGYRVERSTDGSTFTKVYDSQQAGKTQITEKNLPAGTLFAYRVYSYKGDVKGPYSNTVYARTKGQSPLGVGGAGGTGLAFNGSGGTSGRRITDDLFGDLPLTV